MKTQKPLQFVPIQKFFGDLSFGMLWCLLKIPLNRI